MNELIGIIILVILIWNGKATLKFMAFFIVGFMVGLKGINPLKWFEK